MEVALRLLITVAYAYICSHFIASVDTLQLSQNTLVITGYHFGLDTANKIGQKWMIPLNIKKNLTSDAKCGILYTGTLRINKENAKNWLHGPGSLLIESDEITCIYMTNVGIFPGNPHVRLFNVVVNHLHLIIMQDDPYTVNLAMLCQVEAKLSRYESERRCGVMSNLNHNYTIPSLKIHSLCESDKQFCVKMSIIARFALPQENQLKHSMIPNFNTPLKYDTSFHKAACTVQTFKNDATGPMLYLFARYYLELGWLVIVYDRFGQHGQVLSGLRAQYSTRLLYHPYTILQLVFPSIYNEDYYIKQVSGNAVFFAVMVMFTCYPLIDVNVVTGDIFCSLQQAHSKRGQQCRYN
jgi:hypothetical protein